MPALVAASTSSLRVETAGGIRMPGTSPGCSTARAQIHLTAKCRGCCASNRTQHALVERSIVRINRKQWSAPTNGCLAMGEGLEVSGTFHFRFRPVFSSARARMCRRGGARPAVIKRLRLASMSAGVSRASTRSRCVRGWRTPVFSCFFAENTPHAVAGAVAQRKTRRGVPPGFLA